METISALILAGGKSERMTHPKPWLMLDGQTFAEKIIDTYISAGIEKIVLVINKEFCGNEWQNTLQKIKAKTELVDNNHVEMGRFHSIKLGMQKLLGSDFCFLQNVDNPFVTKTIIEELLKRKNIHGSSMPVFTGNTGHPVLISKNVIRYINSQPDIDLNLRDVLKEFPKTKVKTDDSKVLVNINTKEDYELWVK